MPRILAMIGSSIVLTLVAATPVATAVPQRAAHVQKVGITIRTGDRITEPNIALAPGVPVQITVTNDTREFHTFTVPALGVSKLILSAGAHGARKTTFTFTAYHWGPVAWHCVICPSGTHGAAHAMGGVLYLIVDPSALP